MSAYDELYADAVARNAKGKAGLHNQGVVGVLEAHDLRRIGAAIDRARQREGQPLEEHDVLPDYPGQTTSLVLEQRRIGEHGLLVRDGTRLYTAHLSLPGRCLPLAVHRRRFWRDAREERLASARSGPEVALPFKELSRALVVRCDAPAQVATFLDDALVIALMQARHVLEHVLVTPGNDTVDLDISTRADNPQQARPGIALARAAFLAGERVAATPGGFVATRRDAVESDARVPALLPTLEAATAFLAGRVDRVGDAAESRMTLDEPEGLPGVLRVTPVSGGLSLAFSGALSPATKWSVKVRPERTRLERARGLFDKRVGDPELDRAFLINGNADAARLLLTDKSAALALVARGAVLGLDGNGVSVDLPLLPDEQTPLVDAAAATMALWRRAAQKNAGLDEARTVRDD